MTRFLLFVAVVGAATYMFTRPQAVPVCDEKSLITQAEVDSKQQADGPLRSSWGSTLKSLGHKPDTSPTSQDARSYRQAAVYKKMHHQPQTDSGQITGTVDLTGPIDDALTTGTGASDREATQWARVTLAATLHHEASVSSPIVGYSSPGKEVQIREHVNGWFRVQDPETQEGGWIFYKYLAYIHGPTPALNQIAATAEPSVKAASPTSRKPTRISKPAVGASDDHKVAKRHGQKHRIAKHGERRRGLGLFKRRKARAWSLRPAH